MNIPLYTKKQCTFPYSICRAEGQAVCALSKEYTPKNHFFFFFLGIPFGSAVLHAAKGIEYNYLIIIPYTFAVQRVYPIFFVWVYPLLQRVLVQPREFVLQQYLVAECPKSNCVPKVKIEILHYTAPQQQARCCARSTLPADCFVPVVPPTACVCYRAVPSRAVHPGAVDYTRCIIVNSAWYRFSFGAGFCIFVCHVLCFKVR